jgi:hypothetical protein
MKNIVLFIVKYITVFIVGTIMGLLCYYLFLLSDSFSAGSALVFPSITGVMPIARLMVFWAIIASCLFLITRTARQPGVYAAPALVCIFLHILTWFFILPFGSRLVSRIDAGEAPRQRSAISEGYFRRTETELYYYLQVNRDDTGTGIFVGVGPDSGGQPATRLNPPLDLNAGDPLLQNTLEIPELLAILFGEAASYHLSARQAMGEGYLAWGLFASICFPLIALIAFSHASIWKLINFSYIIFCFLCILLINSLYFTLDFPSRLFDLSAVFFRRLPQEIWPYIPLCAVNICLGLFLLIFGVHKYFVTKTQTGSLELQNRRPR